MDLDETWILHSISWDIYPYMLYGFRVRANQKVNFSPNFSLSLVLNYNFKHD